MENNYKGLIWTNHSLQRLKDRNVSQGDAWTTFSHPQKTRKAKTKGAWIFSRNYNGYLIEVTATQNEKKEWVIISVWSKNISLKSNFFDNWLEKILRNLFFKN